MSDVPKSISINLESAEKDQQPGGGRWFTFGLIIDPLDACLPSDWETIWKQVNQGKMGGCGMSAVSSVIFDSTNQTVRISGTSNDPSHYKETFEAWSNDTFEWYSKRV